MSQLVACLVLMEPETFLTDVALEGFLSGVNAFVFGEVALVGKCLPAAVTSVGFQPGVN